MELSLKTDERVMEKINSYPDGVRNRLLFLRDLVIQTASEMDGIFELEETLKWGEPSYLTEHGSTLRMDWKAKAPDQYAMYFKCTSRLVPCFKKVFEDTFNYEKDRAIVFNLDDPIPANELKICIATTLNYHRVKNLEDLGLKPYSL